MYSSILKLLSRFLLLQGNILHIDKTDFYDNIAEPKRNVLSAHNPFCETILSANYGPVEHETLLLIFPLID